MFEPRKLGGSIARVAKTSDGGLEALALALQRGGAPGPSRRDHRRRQARRRSDAVELRHYRPLARPPRAGGGGGGGGRCITVGARLPRSSS